MPRKVKKKKKHERRINFKKVYSETLGYFLTPKWKEGTLETTCTPARLALFHNFFFKYSLYHDISKNTKSSSSVPLLLVKRETVRTNPAANCIVLLHLPRRLAHMYTQWNGVHENLNTYSEENAENLWSNSHFTVYVTYMKKYMMLQSHKCP